MAGDRPSGARGRADQVGVHPPAEDPRTATGPRRLADIAEPTAMVAADTPCAAVEELFQSRPDLASLVVSHPDGSLAMLTRQKFASELIGRLGYGRALYSRRPVSDLPGGGPSLILDASTSLLEGGHAAIARRDAERYDDFVVPDVAGVSTVSVASLFTELAELHAHRSQHDALTGLANRDFFNARLRASLAAGRANAAVLFVDVDDFKSINDSLGHTAGDELLGLLAERLADAFREQDTVARFGGDEFAVLLTGADQRAAVLAAERVALALAAPALIGGRSVGVRASVGIALETPGCTPESLLRDADLAMYVAKRRGAGGHAVFAAAMHAEAVERLELVHDLGSALTAGQLRLEYQPIMNLASGNVTGVEALLRWTHPRRGPVSPLQFIELAEQSGEIVAIGSWVLEEALRQVSEWRSLRTGGDPLIVGVNVSPRQLEEPDFAAEVRAALERHGIPPAELVLEITETALIHDDETTRAHLLELAALGVKLAIDDFGTGYSSLHRLQQLPVGLIKIDKRFVDELSAPDRSGLIRGILLMAGELGIQALAEGIETQSQLDALIDAGCRLGQGYHLSRPLRPEGVGALLAAGEHVDRLGPSSTPATTR